MSVNVLVWGHVENGACAYFRGYQYDEPLKALGVNARHIDRLDGTASVVTREGEAAPLAGIPESEVMARVKRGEWKLKYDLDMEPIEWADVVMFRRYYNTSLRCSANDNFLTSDIAAAEAHGRATGHKVLRQDDITGTMWPAIAARTDKAILYETDDLHLGHGVQRWNGYWVDVQHERDLIAEMTRRADLVTVSTPFLAQACGRYNDNLRVMRNAIDAWRPGSRAPDLPGSASGASVCLPRFCVEAFRRASPVRRAAWAVLVCSILGAAADAGYWIHQRFGRQDLRVTMLDVGRGSAVLLETPGGGTALIDGGGFADEPLGPADHNGQTLVGRQRLGGSEYRRLR